MGQVRSATYNSSGTVMDNSSYYGDSETINGHGNAVSYAFSNEMVRLQTDLVYADCGADSTTDDPNEDLKGLNSV